MTPCLATTARVMKTILPGLCAVLVASAVQAQDIVGPILKPGLWETKVIRLEDNREGQEQVEASRERALARMTPEQRKELEAEMRRQGFDPATGQRRQCFGPMTGRNYFADSLFGMAKLPECTQPQVVDRSDNRTVYEIRCEGKADMPERKTVQTKVVATDDVITIMLEAYATGAGGVKRIIFSKETRMQFIDSDCGDLKSAEQAMQESLNGLNPMGHAMKKALMREEVARKAAQKENKK